MIGEDNSGSVGRKNNGVGSSAGSNTGSTSDNVAAVSGTARIPVAAENDTKRYERLLIVYAPLVSQRVTVFLYDGAVFEGTLDSFETEKSKNEFALILRMATMLQPGREVIDASIKAGITFELMNIRFDDMAELKSNNSNNKTGGIGTDAAISKKKGDFGKERELHRWLPEEQPDLPILTSGGNTNNWDQFATNEKLFGLKTDFNEEMYTTKLDRSSAHIKANEAKAERIAKEIMLASAGGNAHLAEERGQDVLEGDEEMLYGAVIRDFEDKKSNLPPGFAKSGSSSSPSSSSSSTLNPSAPEFKLNVDAPEFKPNRVTYYNQPRRNLMVGANMNNGGSGGGYYGSGYEYQVPYYYIPPVDNNGYNISGYNGGYNNPYSVPVTSSVPVNVPVTPATSEMNPNAADFVMPQPQTQYYHQPSPYYNDGGYGYYNQYQ